jgi:hypothetical protein
MLRRLESQPPRNYWTFRHSALGVTRPRTLSELLTRWFGWGKSDAIDARRPAPASGKLVAEIREALLVAGTGTPNGQACGTNAGGTQSCIATLDLIAALLSGHLHRNTIGAVAVKSSIAGLCGRVAAQSSAH